MIEGKRDGATVTPEGKRLSKLIDGVIVRFDARGEDPIIAATAR